MGVFFVRAQKFFPTRELSIDRYVQGGARMHFAIVGQPLGLGRRPISRPPAFRNRCERNLYSGLQGL